MPLHAKRQKRPRPVIHSRDHEHGGADPVRIAWSSADDGGGDGGPAGLYATKAASATTSDLYTLDPATAVATSIGPTGYAFTALAVDPTTGTLYGGTSAQTLDGINARSLFTIDSETGVATLVGMFSLASAPTTHKVMSDLAFSPSGQLYGFSGETGYLHTIDKSNASYTGAYMGISPTAAGLSFDSAGTLYLLARVSSLFLYTVDPATAAATLIGDLVPSTSLIPAAATFDADGLLWWLNGGGGGTGVRLRTLDVATRGWGVVGTSATDPGDNFDGLAWA